MKICAMSWKSIASLKRQGVISTWHDRRIAAGEEFAGKISENLESADIILDAFVKDVMPFAA